MSKSTHSASRSTAPARPRDAASLVIHRSYRNRHEVLMGRRGHKARFKPGVYVFPGGVLERADFRARPLHPLSAGITPQLAVAGSAAKANALAMAAVREAFEEAGLLFGRAGHIGTTSHRSWQEFGRRALAPDLRELDFLGRAVTPAFQPLRFNARFFGVPFEHLSGELKGDGELEDLRWVRVDQHAGVEMMMVQEMILDTLHKRLRGEPAPAQRLFVNWGRCNIVDV